MAACLAVCLLDGFGHLILVDSISDTRPRSESVSPSRQTEQKTAKNNRQGNHQEQTEPVLTYSAP